MRKVYIKHIDSIEIDNSLLPLIKYNDEKMKEISLKGWSFLHDILLKQYNINLTTEDIIYNEYNKPYIKNNKIYFNISHSKNLIAIIIDNKECGIDIEYIDYSKDVNKFVTKILSIKEQKIYKNKIYKHKYFYKLWTKKEAYYKVLGTGIKYSQLKDDIKYINIKTRILKYNNEKYYISFSK